MSAAGDLLLPEGLEARYRSLRRRPKERAAVRAEAERAVRRIVFGSAKALWVPEVPLDPPKNAAPPHAVEAPAEHHALAGLDDDGRPVLVRGAFGLDGERPRAVLAHPGEERDEFVLHSRVLRWDGPRLEVIGFLTHSSVSHVTRVEHDAAGRPIRFATAGVPYNALGKGAERAECVWEGDRCVRVERRVADDRGRIREETRTGEYDEAGLVRVVRGDGMVMWDRALHGYEPEPTGETEALAVWAEAVVDAARRAVAELEDADVFAVAIRPRWNFDERPAVAWGGGEVRRRAPDPETATVRLPHSAGLIEHLDVHGLRAFRMLRQLGVDEDQPPTAEQIQRHAADVEWPGGALPLVTGLHADPLGLARRVLGEKRVDAAFAGVGGRPSPPPVDRPPASHEEVEALLVAAELPVAIAAQAAWGLALVGGGEGESRLGGRPDLPEGTPWPVFEGLPLTHLATIALGELPDVEGRDLLPESGHLVLMAGLQEDAELHDSDVLGGDPRVALLHVPAGTPLHRPEPPRHDPEGYDPPVVLAERRVRFEPVLTLPQIAHGLPDPAASDYGELYFQLAERTPGLDGHLLLGHPAVVHRDPRGPGDISLLHIGWDPAIGFEYLDGADITIFGAPGDVRAGRWDRLRISVQSG